MLASEKNAIPSNTNVTVEPRQQNRHPLMMPERREGSFDMEEIKSIYC